MFYIVLYQWMNKWILIMVKLYDLDDNKFNKPNHGDDDEYDKD